MSDERGPEALLAERPELESALESVLAVDDEQDGWTFDDVAIDSGEFGELVSRGVVEKEDGEYRVANPRATRAALGEETATTVVDTSDAGFELDLSLPTVELRSVGLVTAALAAVVLTRSYIIGSVYRGGDIVLSGNDPYYYRYWVELIAAEASSGVDFAALSVLPDPVTKGEPLMVATLWWLAELLGGTTESIGHVLAWYPVVSAVVTGVVVYLLAVRITDDQRVGLASVLFLALVPGHAFRTSLGYADHHAFDYVWLGLTALALLVAVTTARDRASLRRVEPWAASVALGFGITGQVLAWEAGPLLVVPVGMVILGKTLLDVEYGRNPLATNATVLIGTGLAAALVWLFHDSWGWHTDLVSLTPTALFLGVVGVVAVAAVTTRLGGTAKHLAAVDGIGAFLVVMLGPRVASERWNQAFARTDSLFRDDAIAETYGLFDPGTLGFLLLFGFALLLALPAMVWAVRNVADDRADWLVLAVYAWYFLVLAAIQVRFVGELAPFVAVFAGYAFVWLAVKVDVARPLISDSDQRLKALVPEPRTLASLAVVFLLVGSLGLVQVPVKTSQVVTDHRVYETAVAIEADAAEQGLEYPENYVLSLWGNSRIFNYFVSGESRSFAYARGNYGDFLRATNGSEWYSRLRGRVGYVVTRERPEAGPQTLQSRLQNQYGSRSEAAAGLGHYRAMHTTGADGYKAFELVPGAVIEGTASPNATVSASTVVSIPNAEFEYARQTRASADGTYRLRVANTGSYTISTANRTETVAVNGTAIQNGTTVAVE